jgi:hypothetical protein|tara:strand:+ start:413 stop:631 length:219 start_codon:yes stop_codon:yes gene_type:complete
MYGSRSHAPSVQQAYSWLVCLWVDDAEAKVLPGQGLGELLVVLAHELHELAIHPQDDKHLELLVGEERIAIR